jgi:SAM-dependent methyltransferase
LVYQSARMTPAELDEFYAAEYRQLYQGTEGPNPKDLLAQQGRAAALLEFVRGRVNQIARHLDLGCSAGVLLAAFRQHYNCQPVGVEPGEAYRQFAQSQTLAVYSDLAALSAAGETRFDLISLAHVLEHLPDPVGYLANLRENHLTPQGWLLLEVPNLYCHDSFEIAHLVSFSAHTLRQTVQQAGFEVIAFKKHGQPRSQLLPLYLTLLARPRTRQNPPSVRPERAVAFKRRLGLLRRRLWQKLWPKQAWRPLAGED